MQLPVFRDSAFKPNARGDYVRNVGYKQHGSRTQEKFNLGRVLSIASDRLEQIRSIYLVSCQVSNSLIWRQSFLNLAKQVEKTGACLETIPEMPDDMPFFLRDRDYSYVQHMRDLGVNISIQGAPAKATVTLAEKVDEHNKPMVTKLHEAIDAYEASRLDSFIGEFQGRDRVSKMIKNIKDNLDDCYLVEFGILEIQKHVDFWKKRPMTKHKNPTRMSKNYAKDLIGEFFKLLHRLDAAYSEFTLPALKSIDRTIKRLPSDAVKSKPKKKMLSPKEAKELYKAATQPMTKLMVAMSINSCGGAAELGRLRVTDFLFNCKHPEAELIGFHEKANWLITTRFKKETHSAALLWPWVAELVKEQIKICEANGWKFLFSDKNGMPLYKCDLIYQELGLPARKTRVWG